MKAHERNLLIRIARRLEDYAQTVDADKDPVANKRRLDRELGDVRELRLFIAHHPCDDDRPVPPPKVG